MVDPARDGEAPPLDVPQLTGRNRVLVSLGMLGFVFVALALGIWWAQDLAGTFVNEGEADMTDEVVFVADAGTYRVVTSGPSRPTIDRTVCDITLADGEELHILGGTGSVNPVETFGTSRVAQFDAVAGPTTVVCTDRIATTFDGGRVQVISSNGPVRFGTWGLVIVGVALILGSLLVGFLRKPKPGA